MTSQVAYDSEERTRRTAAFRYLMHNLKKEEGNVKSTVCRKKTHTDQYLNFMSHHPRHQKLGVVRTIMSRCEVITSEEEHKKEEEYLKGVLIRCGCPSWALKKVKENKKRYTPDKIYIYSVRVCFCVSESMRACLRACVFAYLRVWVRVVSVLTGLFFFARFQLFLYQFQFLRKSGFV